MPDRAMITDPQDFFDRGCGRCDRWDTTACVARVWASGLADLRRICRDTGLTETAKWGHPCYTHGGRNIVLIGATKGDYRLNFFNAALMTDPERLLERQGPNTQHPDSLRFGADRAPADIESSLRAYISEAMSYAERGLRPDKRPAALDLPNELVDAFDADPAFAEGFAALTPGRQRGWVLHYASAKQASTRIARIARSRNAVLAGKGWNDR